MSTSYRRTTDSNSARNTWLVVGLTGTYTALLLLSAGSLDRREISLPYIAVLFIPVRLELLQENNLGLK
jgi:hypothetical protein